MNNKIFLTIKVSCFFLLSQHLGFSQGIITDRPDQTESSATVENGNFQIEAGLLLQYTGADENEVRTVSAPSTLFRIGVHDLFELRILSQWSEERIGDSRIDGINDIEVGTKIQLLQNSEINTEIAFLSHLVIPTGSDGLTLDKYGTINKLSISHTLSEKCSLGYNVGYNYLGEGDGDITYSMALGIAVNNRIGLYIEPYGEFIDMDNHEASFDAGFTYLLNDLLQLDFSFGTGINYDMNYLSIGASWKILGKEQ